MRVNSGEWILNIPSTHYGIIRAYGGGIFRFASGVANFNGVSRFGGTNLVIVSGATLNFNFASTLDTVTFELLSGIVQGSNTLFFSPFSKFHWNGGTVQGSVVINIAPTSTMVWAGGVKDFRGSAIINNYCHSSWTSGDLRYYDGGAIFNNYNVFTIDGAVNVINYNVPVGAQFVNHINGVIYKLNGITDFNASGVTFINYGLVRVNSGEWILNIPSTHYGIIRAYGGGIFRFASGVANFAGTTRFGGTNLVIVSGATLNFNFASTLDTATFELLSGIVQGSDTLFFSPFSKFHWNGGTVHGSVIINIAPTATMVWAGGVKDFRGSAIINNYCHSSWTAGDLRYYDGGARFYNYNTFTVSGTVNLINFNVPSGALFVNKLNAFMYFNGVCNMTASGVTFVNEGLIGGSGTCNIGIPFTHTGIIDPGTNGIGILTLNGAQPLNANCSFNIQLFDGSGPGTGHDQLLRNSNCTLGGTLNVTFTGTVPDGTYTILDCAPHAVSGTFATVNLPPGCTLVINPTNCQIVKNTQNCVPNAGSWTTSACDSLVWNGTTYTTSGQYQQVLTNVGGCDSTVTLNLTVNFTKTGTDVQTACDSYTWLDGITYTASNSTATHTIANGAASGCDSVVTLNLTIYPSHASSISKTECQSYEWNGTTYTTSGEYAHTYTSAHGCDSVVTLSLTITAPPTWYLDADADGYYVADSAACKTPGIGWTSTLPINGAGDCNDNNSAIYPGAPEICGNGIDENCNGSELPCGGGNTCAATNTFVLTNAQPLFVAAGATQSNVYYWGLSYTKPIKANVTGGVGPYTYSWSNTGTGTLVSANGNSVGLFYPTGPTVIKVTVTDLGANCTFTDSIQIGWVDFTCNPTGRLWYYQLCRDGQTTVCVYKTAAMIDSLKTGNYVFGACSPKTDIATANKNLNMEVYPNPNNGEFNVVVQHVDVASTIEVFDFSAKRISTQELKPENGSIIWSYDMRHLPAGVYFIQLKNAEGVLTKKVIIRH